MKISLPDNINEIYINIIKLLKTDCFIVGGFIRDVLLKIESNDIDIATNADKQRLQKTFKDAYFFSKTGTVSFKVNNSHVTIAPFRIESDYIDYRHPNVVKFVDSLYDDYKRRDFTINSLYMDKDYNIIDPSNCGLNDIEKKQIVMIGDPLKRLKEDPLRIIRAYRFKYDLSFEISKSLKEAIEVDKIYLRKIQSNKIHEEILKIKQEYRQIVIDELSLNKD